jgi:hypothetical protein
MRQDELGRYAMHQDISLSNRPPDRPTEDHTTRTTPPSRVDVERIAELVYRMLLDDLAIGRERA